MLNSVGRGTGILYFTGFRSRPVLGAALAPGIFYPEPAPASGKREHNFGFFLN